MALRLGFGARTGKAHSVTVLILVGSRTRAVTRTRVPFPAPARRTVHAFSRTRLTDTLHRRCSTRPGSPWATASATSASGWDNLRCSYLAVERSRVEPTSAAQVSIQSACPKLLRLYPMDLVARAIRPAGPVDRANLAEGHCATPEHRACRSPRSPKMPNMRARVLSVSHVVSSLRIK